jgi:hypothetical protein
MSFQFIMTRSALKVILAMKYTTVLYKLSIMMLRLLKWLLTWLHCGRLQQDLDV